LFVGNSQIQPVFYEEVKLNVNPDFGDFILFENGDLLYYEQPYRSEKIEFVLFNQKGEFISNGTIEAEEKGTKVYSPNFIGNQLFMLVDVRDKDAGLFKKVLRSVDLLNYTMGDSRDLVSIPMKLLEANESVMPQVDYFPSIQCSFFSDSVVVILNDYVNQKYEVKIFNSKIEETRSENLDMKTLGFDYSRIRSVKEDSEGELVYTVDVYNWKEETINKAGEEIDKQTAYVFGNVESTDDLIPKVNVESLKDVPEELFAYDLKDDFAVGGYFTYDEAAVQECFHSFNLFKYEGEIVNDNIHCFDYEYLWGFAVEPLKSMNSKSISKGNGPKKLNMYLSNAVLNEDESVTFFLDQNYQMQNTNDREIYSDLRYWFGNVLALNYSKEGKLNWKHVIPKSQAAAGRSGMLGIKYFSTGEGQTILLYNNLDQDNKMTELHMVSINSEGEVEELMNYVFGKKQEEIIASKFKMKGNSLFIKMKDGKSYKIMKIAL
jgi:hypothetical protein